MFFMCFACFIDRFVNFRKVSFSFNKSNIPVQERKYISSVMTNFQISSYSILEIYTFVSCQYDVFCVFCMFYWQIRQFSLGSIQFQEEVHLRKRKKNIIPV